jgi:hypothetical protein
MRLDDLVGARGGRLKGVVVISQRNPVLTFDLLCSAVVRWLHAAVSMDAAACCTRRAGARLEVGVAASTAAGSSADGRGSERTVASTDGAVDPTARR